LYPKDQKDQNDENSERAVSIKRRVGYTASEPGIDCNEKDLCKIHSSKVQMVSISKMYEICVYQNLIIPISPNARFAWLGAGLVDD
jgi:hypothetical protein